MEKDLCDDGPPVAEIYIVFYVCLFSLEKIICQNKYLVFLVKKYVLKSANQKKRAKGSDQEKKAKSQRIC